jgi:hypothetical protein
MCRGKPLIDKVSQADAHRKGNDYAGMTDNDSSVSFMFQKVDVQFHADDEHEKNQSELAEKV